MHDQSHFEQLLAAARQESEPQRLLFVFAHVDLPDQASAAQRERYLAGRGGALTPLMCVDKAPSDIESFEAFAAESKRAGPPWQIVFAASLAGQDGQPPTANQVESALQSMVEAVRLGSVGRFAAYDASGEPLTFT